MFLGGGFAVYLLMLNSKQSTKRKVRSLEEEVISIRNSLDESVDKLSKKVDSLWAVIIKEKSSNRIVNEEARSDCTGESFTSACDVPIGNNDEKSNNAQTTIGLKFDDLCQKVDYLCDGDDKDQEEALQLLQNYKYLYSDKSEFLWRLSRSHVCLYDLREDYDEKQKHAMSAYDYSKQALEVGGETSNNYKWLAISLGTTTEFLSTKKKIETGWTLREYLTKAIELNEKDAILHYILGRWFYGVYQLSWIERKLAATLFAEPPTATIKEAKDEFEVAELLAPDTNKSNQYYLAKCEYELGDTSKATIWIQSALKLPCTNKDERVIHENCRGMLLRLLRRY